MSTSMTSTATLSIEELADLFAACFEGYVVPLVSTVEGLAARIRGEQVDLSLSRVMLVGGERAGLSLLAQRGSRVRVAAMGIIARRRARGLGGLLLDDSVHVARAAGAHTLVLEVLGINEPAVALYRSGGFRATRRLVGYRRGPLDPVASADHRLAVTDELAAAVAAERGWPWQLAPHTLVAAGPPFEVHALGDDAFAGLIPSRDRLALRMLHVSPPKRRTGLARRLLAAIQARHPGASWDIPPVVPEEFGREALAALGFAPVELFQLEMERPL